MSAWLFHFSFSVSLFISVVYLVGVARFGWFGFACISFFMWHGHDCACAVLCHAIRGDVRRFYVVKYRILLVGGAWCS